jgi:hypothetical protein
MRLGFSANRSAYEAKTPAIKKKVEAQAKQN